MHIPGYATRMVSPAAAHAFAHHVDEQTSTQKTQARSSRPQKNANRVVVQIRKKAAAIFVVGPRDVTRRGREAMQEHDGRGVLSTRFAVTNIDAVDLHATIGLVALVEGSGAACNAPAERAVARA